MASLDISLVNVYRACCSEDKNIVDSSIECVHIICRNRIVDIGILVVDSSGKTIPYFWISDALRNEVLGCPIGNSCGRITHLVVFVAQVGVVCALFV